MMEALRCARVCMSCRTDAACTWVATSSNRENNCTRPIWMPKLKRRATCLIVDYHSGEFRIVAVDNPAYKSMSYAHLHLETAQGSALSPRTVPAPSPSDRRKSDHDIEVNRMMMILRRMHNVRGKEGLYLPVATGHEYEAQIASSRPIWLGLCRLSSHPCNAWKPLGRLLSG